MDRIDLNILNELQQNARITNQELSERVNLSPSQLSGGEKQRVAIARAFAAEPEIVLCDEVTSALDVSVQAAVLDLLNVLKKERGTTYIFVSHDLAVVKAISDRVAVLYQGRLCEIGPSDAVYQAPFHPYTDVLLGAVLEPDPDTAPTLSADDVVELSPPAKGCPFQRRCPKKLGEIRPAMVFRIVDLPLPLSPTRPRVSPFSILILILSTVAGGGGLLLKNCVRNPDFA